MNIDTNFYNNALNFCLNILKKQSKNNHIEKEDIVHDVICDERFSLDSWKGLIVSKVYEYKNRKFIYSLDSLPKNKDWIEHRYCKHCDMVMPEDYFISGFNSKTNEFQYRTICKKCHRKTDKEKERRKQYSIQYLKNNRDRINKMRRERHKLYGDKTARERYLR